MYEKMEWDQILLDKNFDDTSKGHHYMLACRLEIYLFHRHLGKGNYGKRGRALRLGRIKQGDFF